MTPITLFPYRFGVPLFNRFTHWAVKSLRPYLSSEKCISAQWRAPWCRICLFLRVTWSSNREGILISHLLHVSALVSIHAVFANFYLTHILAPSFFSKSKNISRSCSPISFFAHVKIDFGRELALQADKKNPCRRCSSILRYVTAWYAWIASWSEITV